MLCTVWTDDSDPMGRRIEFLQTQSKECFSSLNCLTHYAPTLGFSDVRRPCVRSCLYGNTVFVKPTVDCVFCVSI